MATLTSEESFVRDRIAWIGAEIVPHERDVRSWLRRSSLRALDEDDVIQEAYARVAATPSVQQIREPRAYFFTAVRNIVLEHLRRAKVTPIAVVADFQEAFVVDDSPDPEKIAVDRDELRRVIDMIEALPEKLRQVLWLRRVEGLSQREIARRLGVPESTVEKRAAKALRLLLSELSAAEAASAARAPPMRSTRRGWL
jgi:RNA polymerase sigma-70 factor (ECF subfamily)